MDVLGTSRLHAMRMHWGHLGCVVILRAISWFRCTNSPYSGSELCEEICLYNQGGHSSLKGQGSPALAAGWLGNKKWSAPASWLLAGFSWVALCGQIARATLAEQISISILVYV